MKTVRFDNPYIKYTLPLFFILLISKTLYILGEGYINHYLIEISLQKSIGQAELENLKQTIRLLSSAGLLLLLAPLIYFVLQRIIIQLSHFYLAILAVSITLFLTFYIFSHHLIEYYVDQKKDDYYKAYALNLLRYGILSDSLTFTKLIDKTRVSDYTVDDKVLLLNLWILTMDKDIKNVESVLDRGKENIAKQYYNDKSIEDKQTIEEHAKYQNELNRLAKKLESAWNSYLSGLQEANTKHQNLLSNENIIKEYGNILTSIEELLQDRYRKYQVEQQYYLDKIENKTTLSNVNTMHKQLTHYFNDPENEEVQNSYRSAMNFYFNHNIEPDRWCGTKIVTEYILFLIPYESEELSCPTNRKIIEVITEEANRKWHEQSDGIAHNITSFDDYKKNTNVLDRLRVTVNERLSSALSSSLTYDNLSLKNFAIQYQIKVEQEIRSSVDIKMKESFSQYKMPKNMTWEQFVNSNFVKDQMRAEFIPEYIIHDALEIITSKNLNRFDAYFNHDSIEQIQLNIDDNLYDLKHNVVTDEKSMEYGRASYYLIYVIPLFLIFTLLITVINLVSVALMIVAFGLYLFRDTIENKNIGHLIPYGIATVDSFLILLILFIALTTPNSAFFSYHHYINKVYVNVDNQYHQHYFNLLSWVANFEGSSYAITDKLQRDDKKESK